MGVLVEFSVEKLGKSRSLVGLDRATRVRQPLETIAAPLLIQNRTKQNQTLERPKKKKELKYLEREREGGRGANLLPRKARLSSSLRSSIAILFFFSVFSSSTISTLLLKLCTFLSGRVGFVGAAAKRRVEQMSRGV